MSALLALFLFAAPVRAGVVMPVENGVAPGGPSVTGVPVLTPSGGGFITPSFGGIDLRGGLPLLPSPVPGLLGAPLHFVGDAQEAAAIHGVPGVEHIETTPAKIQPGRAFDKTPAIPGKIISGGTTLAISRDRKSSAAASDRGSSAANLNSGEAAKQPFVDPAQVQNARPEKTAELGRVFFDGGDKKERGTVADVESSAPGATSELLSSPGTDGPANNGGLSLGNTGAAFGGGHDLGKNAYSYAPEGEALHDAVASPGFIPGAPAQGGSVSAYFGATSPNGDPSVTATPGLHGSAVLSIPLAPRPLSLDLSGSGLIVRVRAALNGVIGLSAPSSSSLPPLTTPGPSTALLERGGMLEAFSVARAYADGGSPSVVVKDASPGFAAKSAKGFSRGLDAEGPSTAPLWWAWLILPLFVAAFRGL